ncbi:MAG TPA: hypothetical protein VN083_02300, partial [Vicinamibacteria bacterium]|nr:hypothetical protein [Vicinamibacteria bacterium]
TILQSLLGMVLLVNMRYSWWEAFALFLLWFAQFAVPSLRVVVSVVYGVLIGAGLLDMLRGGRGVAAFTEFATQFRTRVLSGGG